jgi:hypothetical protein
MLALPLMSLAVGPSDAVAIPACAAGTYSSYVALGSTGCTIGDKLFYDFKQVPDTTVINVGLVPNSFGFIFAFSLTAQGSQDEDLSIAYNVATLSGAPLIRDVSVTQAGLVTGGGFAHIGETVCLGNTWQACGSAVQVGTFDLAGNTNDQLTNSITFTPVSLIGLIKDFNVDADLFGRTTLDIASITTVVNTVSQIPEPGTLLLIGSGLAGLGAWGRKKLRK